VDFEQSEEQQMVRDLVRDWAEAELTPTIEVRDKQQQAPVEEWQRFCELGLHGITIPEQHGGNPLDDICEAIAARRSHCTAATRCSRSISAACQGLMSEHTHSRKRVRERMRRRSPAKRNSRMMGSSTSSMGRRCG